MPGERMSFQIKRQHREVGGRDAADATRLAQADGTDPRQFLVRIMLTLLRAVAAGILLVLMGAAASGRDDDDPVYDKKKASEWVDALINDASPRKRRWRSMRSPRSGR